MTFAGQLFPENISSNFYHSGECPYSIWLETNGFPTFGKGLQTSQIFWQPYKIFFFTKILNILFQLPDISFPIYLMISKYAFQFPNFLKFPLNFSLYKAIKFQFIQSTNIPNVLNTAIALSGKWFDLKLNIKWTRYCSYLIFVIFSSTDRICD